MSSIAVIQHSSACILYKLRDKYQKELQSLPRKIEEWEKNKPEIMPTTQAISDTEEDYFKTIENIYYKCTKFSLVINRAIVVLTQLPELCSEKEKPQAYEILLNKISEIEPLRVKIKNMLKRIEPLRYDENKPIRKACVSKGALFISECMGYTIYVRFQINYPEFASSVQECANFVLAMQKTPIQMKTEENILEYLEFKEILSQMKSFSYFLNQGANTIKKISKLSTNETAYETPILQRKQEATETCAQHMGNLTKVMAHYLKQCPQPQSLNLCSPKKGKIAKKSLSSPASFSGKSRPFSLQPSHGISFALSTTSSSSSSSSSIISSTTPFLSSFTHSESSSPSIASVFAPLKDISDF